MDYNDPGSSMLDILAMYAFFLVFEGPVPGLQKDQGLDWTRLQSWSCSGSLVLSGLVLILKIFWDVKDWS